MNADIESAARHLFEFIRAPRGVVGVLAWPDLTQPRIRVFVAPGSRHQMAAVPAEFEGYPVEMMTGGDITPFCRGRIENRPFYSFTPIVALGMEITGVTADDYSFYCRFPRP